VASKSHRTKCAGRFGSGSDEHDGEREMMAAGSTLAHWVPRHAGVLLAYY